MKYCYNNKCRHTNIWVCQHVVSHHLFPIIKFADLFLTHYKIILQNNDGDTALLCASQYGHTSVVSLLLQNGSDPTCRNHKEESALDLAAQYGRADTVEVLLRTRPSLVRNLTQKHSPLHLASRNGHKHVVKMLLDAKFDVNYCVSFLLLFIIYINVICRNNAGINLQ